MSPLMLNFYVILLSFPSYYSYFFPPSLFLHFFVWLHPTSFDSFTSFFIPFILLLPPYHVLPALISSSLTSILLPLTRTFSLSFPSSPTVISLAIVCVTILETYLNNKGYNFVQVIVISKLWSVGVWFLWATPFFALRYGRDKRYFNNSIPSAPTPPNSPNSPA